MPIFGYGAKTNTFSNKTSTMFPLSRSIRNPFTPNDQGTLEQTYSDCLSTLELSVPVNLNPLVSFFKRLGDHQEKRLKRKGKDQPLMRGTVDCFYVMYVLSTGIIDDVQELIKTISQKEWSRMPLQLHIISMAPNHLQKNDQDSQHLMEECVRLNNDVVGWPQFQVHFYDRIKKSCRGRSSVSLHKLKQESVLRVPRDIESFIFCNSYDLSKYKHNKNLTNATQSQQYIMDLID